MCIVSLFSTPSPFPLPQFLVLAFKQCAVGLLFCQGKALPLTSLQKQLKGMACSVLLRVAPDLSSVLWGLLVDLFHRLSV